MAGILTFVGLVVPHCVRALVGADHRRVLPLSLGYGAVLTVVADTAGRIRIEEGQSPGTVPGDSPL